MTLRSCLVCCILPLPVDNQVNDEPYVIPQKSDVRFAHDDLVSPRLRVVELGTTMLGDTDLERLARPDGARCSFRWNARGDDAVEKVSLHLKIVSALAHDPGRKVSHHPDRLERLYSRTSLCFTHVHIRIVAAVHTPI